MRLHSAVDAGELAGFHGGARIVVQSTPGEGALFSVEILARASP